MIPGLLSNRKHFSRFRSRREERPRPAPADIAEARFQVQTVIAGLERAWLAPREYRPGGDVLRGWAARLLAAAAFAGGAGEFQARRLSRGAMALAAAGPDFQCQFDRTVRYWLRDLRDISAGILGLYRQPDPGREGARP